MQFGTDHRITLQEQETAHGLENNSAQTGVPSKTLGVHLSEV
jgi:hypothetical protein